MPDEQATEAGRLWTRYFVALGVVSFLSSFISSPLYSLLPVYVEAALLRTPMFSAGLRALFLFLGGVVALPAGKLCDDLGAKRVILLGIAGPLLAGAVFMTGSPFLLTALCVGIGLSYGFSSTGGQSYLLGAVSPSVIGMASAAFFLCGTLGTASGNLLAGPIADRLGYGTLGAAACVAALGLILGTAFLLPRLPRSTGGGDGPPSTLSGSLGLLRRREVQLLMGIRYLPTCYWGAVTLLVPLLIFRHTGTNTSATVFSAVSLVVAAGFQLLTGHLCDRSGRWRPILVSASFVVLSAVGLALAGHTLVGLYVFGVMAAASAWSLSTTMPGLLRLIARNGESGRVVGMAHVAWSAGMLSGNIGGGRLVEWGSGVPFTVAAVFCLGAVGCGIGLYRFYRATDRPPDRTRLE